ncbi:MAG: hypothetical protein HYY84_20340 [Deltaproteobacteria bacterium]|nr:hypothetical protein [Deltaproteobacteria bacterium]
MSRRAGSALALIGLLIACGSNQPLEVDPNSWDADEAGPVLRPFEDAGFNAPDAGLTRTDGGTAFCPPGFRDNDGDPANGCETPCAPVAIATSGNLDFDLKVVNVTGRVTLAGFRLPDGTPRGTLRFLLAGTTIPVDVDLPTTGEATYNVNLFAGAYRITYERATDCRVGAPPCGIQELRRAIPLNANGVLNLDIAGDVVVSGEVTVNGQAISARTGGGNRGSIAFSPAEATGTRVTELLGASGRATYSARLLPGVYDVSIVGPSTCDPAQDPVPCHASVRLRRFAVATSGNLNIDLPVVTVAGRVTLNGATMPNGPSGWPRGNLLIANTDGIGGPTVDLGPRDEATYRARIYKGVQSFVVSKFTQCDAGPLPCQTREAVRDIRIDTDGRLDLDLRVARVSGVVTVNGAPVANAAGNPSRGRVEFRDATGLATATLARTGPAAYSAPLYEGRYDVAISSFESCAEGPLPCLTRTVAASVAVAGPAALNIDVPVVDVRGRVTANGNALGDGVASRLVFSPAAPRATGVGTVQGESTVELSSRGATYRVRLYAGTYRAQVRPAPNCVDGEDGALPCQGNINVDAAAQFTTTGVRDFDLRVVTVTGSVTINGRAVFDDRTGHERGALSFAAGDGAYPNRVSLGSNGPATYRARIFAGTQGIGLLNDVACENGAIPCGHLALRGCRTW